MRHWVGRAFCAVTAVWGGASTGQLPLPVPSVMPMPRVVPEGMLMTWKVDVLDCGDAKPVMIREPVPAAAIRHGGFTAMPSVFFLFRIDAAGRPLGIRRVDQAYTADTEDLAPALATARFAAGEPRERCTLSFLGGQEPISMASRDDAMWYTMFPTSTPPRDVWERTRPVGSTCFEPAPAPLLRAYPDFKVMAGEPGRRAWSMVGFDLDAGGRPVRPHVVAGSGLAPLDTASVKAVAASRFEKGARTGCLYPYYRNAVTLPAPTPPEEDSLRPAGATCPRSLPFATPPRLIFPGAYQRRSIEGWAVMAYDVAPWGEIGNVRVLAAEPAADFGEWGKRVLAGARKAPGPTGYTGCVDRVLFRIGPQARVLTGERVPESDITG